MRGDGSYGREEATSVVREFLYGGVNTGCRRRRDITRRRRSKGEDTATRAPWSGEFERKTKLSHTKVRSLGIRTPSYTLDNETHLKSWTHKYLSKYLV